MNHLHSKEAVWKKTTVNNTISFWGDEGGESRIRHIEILSDRKKSTDFSSLFMPLRSEKNYSLTTFLQGRFSFAKDSSGYHHCFSAWKNKRLLEEPEAWHAQGKANVSLARSNESCISWHCQTETPILCFGAMAGQTCQGGRAWTAEINEFTSFGDVSHLSTQHQTCCL